MEKELLDDYIKEIHKMKKELEDTIKELVRVIDEAKANTAKHQQLNTELTTIKADVEKAKADIEILKPKAIE